MLKGKVIAFGVLEKQKKYKNLHFYLKNFRKRAN